MKKKSLFLSYSSKDAVIARKIHHWLTSSAGLSAWKDDKSISPGAAISRSIEKGLPNSRNFVALVSENWKTSEWCPGEWKAAVEHRKVNPGFEVIPIQIDDCSLPIEVGSSRVLKAPGGILDIQDAAHLLTTLTDSIYDGEIADKKDVYVARPWSGEFGIGLSNYVIDQLGKAGFRPIGDAKDQDHFDKETRVQSIMKSCGGVVGVFPNRDKGHTSKYIISEMNMARKMGLPFLGITDSDSAVLHAEFSGENIPETVIPTAEAESMLHTCQSNFDGDEPKGDPVFSSSLTTRLEDFHYEWKPPSSPHQLFLAASLNEEWSDQKDVGADLITRTLASPCIVGDRITGGGAQKQIVSRIVQSIAVVADVTDEKKGHSLNTCIEAGIALGGIEMGEQLREELVSGGIGYTGIRTLHLIARGKRQRPDIYMFFDYDISYYEDELEYLALLHRIARKYRRSVIYPDQ